MPEPLHYETLSEEDRLRIAEDRLRGLEADHYRLAISDSLEDGHRIERVERKILKVRDEIGKLKDKKRKHTAAPEAGL